MQRTTKWILALAAVPLAGAAALWASPATPSASPRHAERAQLLVGNGGEDDRLVIDDLDTLKPGESRTYLTENGKSILATRDEQGVELDVDGRKIRLADDPETLPGAGTSHFTMRRIEVDDDGGTRLRIERQGAPAGDDLQAIELGNGEPRHLVIVRRGDGLPDGHPGHARGAAVELLPGEGEATLLGAGALLARLDRNSKFQSLDPTTQQLVRDAIRESTPGASRLEDFGDPGHGLKIEIVDPEGRERDPK